MNRVATLMRWPLTTWHGTSQACRLRGMRRHPLSSLFAVNAACDRRQSADSAKITRDLSTSDGGRCMLRQTTTCSEHHDVGVAISQLPQGSGCPRILYACQQRIFQQAYAIEPTHGSAMGRPRASLTPRGRTAHSGRLCLAEARATCARLIADVRGRVGWTR